MTSVVSNLAKSAPKLTWIRKYMNQTKKRVNQYGIWVNITTLESLSLFSRITISSHHNDICNQHFGQVCQ